MRHFKFQLTNGVETIPVDVMKDTLGNATNPLNNIVGDRVEIKTIEAPLDCPFRKRHGATHTVGDYRLTSRPDCGITKAWDNN